MAGVTDSSYSPAAYRGGGRCQTRAFPQCDLRSIVGGNTSALPEMRRISKIMIAVRKEDAFENARDAAKVLRQSRSSAYQIRTGSDELCSNG